MKRLLTFLLLTTSALPAQDWRSITVPGDWESQMGPHDGFAWYRCFVEVPAAWRGSRLLLTVRRVDDVDEAYFNGTRVGANGGMPPLFAKPSSHVRRPAVIDPDQVRWGEMNLVAFRVYDEKGNGGILEGPIQLGRLEDAIDLSGTWDFIAGDRREYAHWPNRDPDSPASLALLRAFASRNPSQPAGHLGVVGADVEGRERDLALVRKRFEGNPNVHSQVAGKGDPLPPAEALGALTAGDDFAIALVLSEPTVTQPLHVEFDARGRMWVTQYIQYPQPAGLRVLTWDNHLRTIFDAVPPPPPYHRPEDRKYLGRDKISIHEDTDGDGRYDEHKIFAEGLNIVTSTCQGKGGVWVLNPPYLLFFPDADGDDVPDGAPVVHLSGFGLEDTHSVANSLKWGPDNWLYGCVGSTVTARVRVHSKPSHPPMTFFGQNVWRYHPKTHAFELFAEGGWNNFGVDFDAQGRLYSGTNGSMQAVYFVQGGFYQKSFGKHGPHTNPYAFDYFGGIPIEGKPQRLVQQWVPYGGGAFPGHDGHFFGVNCLANRVAVLAMERDGSTFKSRELQAAIESGDVWFRPVHATTGPDGSIYVSDFYDARITHVDPRDNWDRDHGRVYRLRHREGRAHRPVDLAGQSAAELVGYLDHPSQWHRWTARRLLAEREDPTVLPALRDLLGREGQAALEALWTLHALDAVSEDIFAEALRHPSHLQVRLWAVRLLGDRGQALSPAIFERVLALAGAEEPELISQLAASLQRLPSGQALPLIGRILRSGRFTSDAYIPSQLWWALERHVSQDPDAVLAWLTRSDLWSTPMMETKLAGLLARRLASDPSPANLERAAQLLQAAPDADTLRTLIQGLEKGLRGIALARVPADLELALAKRWSAGEPDVDLIVFGIRLKSAVAMEAAMDMVGGKKNVSTSGRVKLISRLAESPRPALTALLGDLAGGDPGPAIQRAALNGLRQAQGREIPAKILRIAIQSPDEGVRRTALAVLTSRRSWAKVLLDAVEAEALPRETVSLDQILVMQGHGDEALRTRIRKLWGRLNQPDEVKRRRIAETIKRVKNDPGNPDAGSLIFNQACAACHKLFGRGGLMGPDLTGYERSNLEFLVTAIVDPNLGVREEYELTQVTLRPARGAKEPTIVSGFVKELTDAQLKLQDLTGHETVVATRHILRRENSPVSIMPEGLLDALTEVEVADLFAYLQALEDPTP